MIPGVVLGGTGGVWRVRADDGRIVEAALRGRLKKHEDFKAREARLAREGNRGAAARVRGRTRVDTRSAEEVEAAPQKLAVGDAVQLEHDAERDAWAIATIEPRRSQLARRTPGGGYGERIVAANVDQVLVVFAAANPDPHPRMLDRFLVIAESNGLSAHVVINKAELVGTARVRERFADYAAAGYVLHVTSTVSGDGLAPLRDALAGRTTALSGPSGVGKSSLMNAMFPGLALRVGEVSASVNKGRHTTVGALLHPLPGGGFVVDTPGLREVGMWGLEPEHLDEHFPEFRPYRLECRFADCTHRVEPGCAVREALEAGRIGTARYESYVKIRGELEADVPPWEWS
ncbi:MAG: ribosome small subunit-dependent GTPase A [Gemmatimonadaceae bacterium]|nr:ribosome small subunit-dependent GTPase A [Gemmatimonadaceae bacterium]